MNAWEFCLLYECIVCPFNSSLGHCLKMLQTVEGTKKVQHEKGTMEHLFFFKGPIPKFSILRSLLMHFFSRPFYIAAKICLWSTFNWLTTNLPAGYRYFLQGIH